tara:strand:+ start:45 stop:317 length:273 start_codon:yes stop_codon:yes gene_type:complete
METHKQHNYTNPSESQDLSHVEASVTKGKKYYDDQGWEIRGPISDRECIYKCLQNCINLAGLDKKQVERLAKQFSVEKTDEQIQSEYPPL